MYIIVFMIFFFFFVIWSWLISRYKNFANGPKDRINNVLVHFKKISNFHVFCTQTYMQNADFGQILGRRVRCQIDPPPPPPQLR